jgi:hypothetical protein
MQEVEEIDDLLHGKGGTGLLAIPKGRISNKDFFGRGDGDDFVVEIDPTDFIVGENIAL